MTRLTVNPRTNALISIEPSQSRKELRQEAQILDLGSDCIVAGIATPEEVRSALVQG